MPAQVLVVDQNPLVQTTIENSLNSKNCEVTSVRDALSGLDLAYKIKPDLMIADLRMEGLMVYSFCARVKQKSFLSHIPIFLMVQQNDVYDEARLRQSGVVGFIQKPVDPVKLTESLNPFLTRFADTPVPAGSPDSRSSSSLPPFPGNSKENGEEFNMDQTLLDKTIVETKTDHSAIKPEETVKMDDLMDWAQPEVSPFSEVISTPLQDDSSESAQFADVTQFMEENKEDITQFSGEAGEVNEYPQLSGTSQLEKEKVETNFLLEKLVQEPVIDQASKASEGGPNGAMQSPVLEKIKHFEPEPGISPIQSVNGKPEVSDIPYTTKPVSMLLGDNQEISKAAQEIIEKVAWEVVPYLTEQAIKKELISTIIEKVIWEVLPPIAEQAVKEAIKKISEEQEHSPS